uniref:NB-ARC domain-containing protein n=1 Tax=Oryza meridionalis TaxID=40149 RepID=A0A0E0DIJ8_9ORYZ
MMWLVGSVVDAAIGCLVQSILGSFFTEQMEAWTHEIGLAEDIEKLEFEMKAVERVLAAAEGRSIDNKPLAQSLGSLRELLYDAEDVMDELDYHRLKHQIEKGEGSSAAADNNPGTNYAASSISSSAYQLICSARQKITSWISSDRKRKREEEEPTDSTMLPLDIKRDISKRINRIVNNLQKTGKSVSGVLQLEIPCRGLTSNQRHRMARNTRLTTSVPIEPKVYGRDADKDRIIEMLINEGSSDLLVLPIVGIGGIGKTTLARFVYRDQRIIDHFDLQIWICVSTNFNEVRLMLEILEHVCKDRQEYRDVSSFNVLQEILLKNIRDKRFLIILDDMWEDRDNSGWDKLLAPLKCNQVTGCAVLATTRRNSVAQMIGTVNAFQISGLDKKEFWLFFKACAFGNEAYEGQPSLHSIGQKIAKALKGCPLAARSVGALLNRDVSYEHWRTVQDKWKSLQVKDDDIIPILKLSYDYLPFHLQCCFSYCSLFPEDHQFSGETLVQAWISQNFVQYEDTGMGLEETGLQYLANLVDFGFFQKVGSDYAMHDLMHELAEQVSSNECTTINGLQRNLIPPNIRHLSIITTSHDNDLDFPIEKFEEILQKIRHFQKLRSLMGVVIPRALTSFYHLQVLIVGIYGPSHVVHDVPTSMNNLVNLRHLIAHDKGIPTHPTTEKKYGFNIKSDELIMLDDKILAFHNLRGIGSLFIKDCPNLVSISSEGPNQLIDLEGLYVTGCPNFTMTSGLVLPSVRFLSLQSCAISGSWLTEMLSHVRSLKTLKLHDCPQIKFLSFSEPAAMEGASSLGSAATHSDRDEQLLKIPSNIIHSLRDLFISNCPDLEFGGEEGALRGYTSLESIKVQSCPKLIPLLVSGKMEVGSLPPSLRSLDIDMDPELSTVWDLKLQELEQGVNQVPPPPPSLDTLCITNLTDKVQSRLLSFLPTITTLVISASPELTSLQLGYSKALEELIIVDCESLASVEGFGSLTNLRSLTVYDSPSLPRCFEILSQQQGASEILSRLDNLQIGDGSILTVTRCKQLILWQAYPSGLHEASVVRR